MRNLGHSLEVALAGAKGVLVHGGRDVGAGAGIKQRRNALLHACKSTHGPVQTAGVNRLWCIGQTRLKEVRAMGQLHQQSNWPLHPANGKCLHPLRSGLHTAVRTWWDRGGGVDMA